MAEPELNNERLRWYFIAATCIGSAGIILGLPTRSAPLVSAVLTIGVPLAAMALYLVAAYHHDPLNFSTHQFADSVYYIGFLLTLISMIVSLFALATPLSGELELGGVVSRFGVALATTVVGLMIRIYLTNFRITIDDSVGRTEAALSKAGANLRKHLEDTSRELISQQKLINTTLATALAETGTAIAAASDAYKEAAGNSTKIFEDAASSAEKTIRESTEVASGLISDSAGSVSAALDQAQALLSKSAEVLGRSSRGLQSAFERTTRDTEANLDRATRAAGAALATAAEAGSEAQLRMTNRTNSLSEALDQITSQATNASTALASIQALEGSASRFGQSLGTSTEEVGNLGSALTAYSDAIRVFGNEVSMMQSQASRDSDAITLHRKKLHEQVSQAAEDLALMQRHLVEAADYVRRELAE